MDAIFPNPPLILAGVVILLLTFYRWLKKQD